MIVTISNSSIKRCRTQFPYKGVGKLINSAVKLLELVPVEVVISECIYDYTNPKFYNVLLYLIRENCTNDKIINELTSFNYIEDIN